MQLAARVAWVFRIDPLTVLDTRHPADLAIRTAAALVILHDAKQARDNG